MSAYRFLNSDRTLVLRDGHVIAWDPRANQPADPQPSAASHATAKPPNVVAEPYDDRDNLARASLLGVAARALPSTPPDEMQIWRDAGSPQPAAARRAVGQPPAGIIDDFTRPPEIARVMTTVPRNDAALADAGAALDAVEAALPKLRADDIAGLRAQVATLTKVVRGIVGGRG